jgi:uncharacterized protein involved in outer membrane biogenesis
MKRVLSRTAAVLLVAVGACVLALAFPGFWLKPLLENRLSAQLGRAVEIEGPVDLVVFNPPTVFAQGVAVANPAWAQDPWLLQAERLRIVFDRAALWSLTLRPTIIALKAPYLSLSRNAQGAATWDIPGLDRDLGDASGTNDSLLDTVILQDGHFRLHVPNQATDITGRLDATAEGTAYTAAGTIRGHRADLTGSGGLLLPLLRGGEPWPLDMSGTVGAHALTARGTLTELPVPTGLDLSLTGRGPDLAGLGALVDVPLPPSPPYDLTGRLTLLDGRWQFSDAAGTLGTSRLSGLVAVEPSPRTDSPLLLTVDVSADHLNVADLPPLSVITSGAGAFHHAATITVEAETLVVGAVILSNVQAQGTMRGGTLRLSPISLELGEGRAVGEAVLADGSAPTGTATFLLSDGDVGRKWLEAVSPALADALIPSDAESTSLRCAAVGLTLQQGQANATLYAETGNALLRAAGSIALETVTVDLAARVDPQNAEDASRPGFLHIAGPLLSPTTTQDGLPPARLKTLEKMDSPGGNGCQRAWEEDQSRILAPENSPP